MKSIADGMKSYQFMKPISDYNWDLQDPPIPIPDGTAFERNVFLKENLAETLKNDTSLDTHYWVIQQWGKIGSFKRSNKNDARIRNFLDGLHSGRKKLLRSEMDCISSLSKIASFFDHTKYAIYDSRAVLALNWLTFKHTEAGPLFPQPIGRGAATELSLDTIVALSRRPHKYHNWNTAYHNYCELVSNLSWDVYDKTDKPYLAEMLLFMAAEELVGDDIRQSVRVDLLGISPILRTHI